MMFVDVNGAARGNARIVLEVGIGPAAQAIAEVRDRRAVVVKPGFLSTGFRVGLLRTTFTSIGSLVESGLDPR
jgi:hypothetical protein